MRNYWAGVMLGAAVLTSGCFGKAAPAETLAVPESSVEVYIEVTEPETEPEAETEGSAAAEVPTETEETLDAAGEVSELSEEEQTSEETLTSQEEASFSLRLYKQLVENPTAYQNQVIVFSGSVIRAASDGASTSQIVLAVEGREPAKLVCDYQEGLIDLKLMAGDQVTVTGIFQALNRYRMDSGEIETLPAIQVTSFDTVTLAARETKAAAETATPSDMAGSGVE